MERSRPIERVLVFCGSSPGRRPEYLQAATALGRQLATEGVVTVYGGASLGMMGALADGALAAGGEVVPIGLLDVAGYYAPLLTFLDHAVTERLLRAEQRDTLLLDTDAAALLAQLRAHRHTPVAKWLDRGGSAQ